MDPNLQFALLVLGITTLAGSAIAYERACARSNKIRRTILLVLKDGPQTEEQIAAFCEKTADKKRVSATLNELKTERVIDEGYAITELGRYHLGILEALVYL